LNPIHKIYQQRLTDPVFGFYKYCLGKALSDGKLVSEENQEKR